MDNGTKGQAISEGCSQVSDLHIGVRVCDLLAPFLQPSKPSPARHPCSHLPTAQGNDAQSVHTTMTIIRHLLVPKIKFLSHTYGHTPLMCGFIDYDNLWWFIEGSV